MSIELPPPRLFRAAIVRKSNDVALLEEALKTPEIQATVSAVAQKQPNDRPTGKRPPPPPPPPCREFKTIFFGGEAETQKSIQRRRDYAMFMRGFRFAHGEQNIPQPGDYV